MEIQKFIDMRAEEFEQEFHSGKPLGLNDIKSFNSETIAGVLKMVREGVGSKKKEIKELMQEEGVFRGLEVIDRSRDQSYNKALDDILSLLPNLDK